jgi:hypothetical protein
MLRVMNLIDKHGWLVVLSFFYPVYWSQDINICNNGYDILSLRDPGTSYFRGTWKQNVDFFS